MRRMILAAVLAVVMSLPAAHAIRVTSEEAQRAAENYVRLIIAKDGSWGGHEDATVSSVEPFTRGPRVLGYFCAVQPVGYLIIGLFRELAPVRLYSVRSNLDPRAEGGLTAFIQNRQATLHDRIAELEGRLEELASAHDQESRIVWLP